MKPSSNTLQAMSSSSSSFTQPPSSTPTSSATINVVPQLVSPTISNSTSVITQSSSKSWLHGPSNHSQQLTLTPSTNEIPTKSPIFTGISEMPEVAEVFEKFELSCEISTSSDTDDNEEWDFLDDLKSPTSFSAEDLDLDDQEISDADDVELSEVLDDFKHLIPVYEKVSSDSEEWDVLDDFNPILPLPDEIALETGRYEEISSDSEESEILDDFNPVLPLPDEADVKTERYEEISSDNEECGVLDDVNPILEDEVALETGIYEEVLFEDQASQYKRGEQDWKEQNLCIVKILHNICNGRVRLLIRRKEVPKVCANHYITPELQILPLEDLAHAWRWVAPENENEKMEQENFCIQFKDANLAAVFEAAFIKAVNISNDSNTNSLSNSILGKAYLDALSKEIELEFFTKATWCCRCCKTKNGKDKQFCFICKARKPCWCKSSSKVPETHKCARYEPGRLEHTLSWFCNLCETINEADKSYCVICESQKPF